MTRLRASPYVWVTWLSKLMAGEVHCLWAPWFKAHYAEFEKAPSDFQRAQWNAEHSHHLSELRGERVEQGERVFIESQNWFKVRMSESGLILAGKPDLVAISPAGEHTIYDVKTGTPKESDLIQVMLYMLCLPCGSSIYKRGTTFAGCVVYKTGARAPIPADAITSEFKSSARHFLDQIDAQLQPDRVPSVLECRFCDITAADCPERIEPVLGDGG